MLPQISNEFFKKLEEPLWEQTIRRAIYWYIQSNISTAGEGGVILGQTALELLSWNLLVNDQNILDKKSFKKRSAAEQIREMLSHCQIPLNLPSSCAELSKLPAKFNLNGNNDGPRLITYVRNKIVHPTGPSFNTGVYLEASKLTLYYLELSLLQILGYQGVYSNRLTAEWEGEVENVPWAA